MVQGILTILRDSKTSREDFIFFADRLATLLMEKATEHLPFVSKNVVTPIGVTAAGTELTAKVGITLSLNEPEVDWELL